MKSYPTETAGLTMMRIGCDKGAYIWMEQGAMNPQVSIPKARLASFCQAKGIKRLAVFGSALRSDFGPESDIDLLVEFEPGRTPGLLGIAGMELDLGRMLGRKVDLRTPGDLSRYFRQQVIDEAQVQYERQ